MTRKTKAKPKVKAKVKPAPKAKAKPAPKAKVKPAPKAKPIAKAKAKPKAAAATKQKPKAAATKDWRQFLRPFFEKRCVLRVPAFDLEEPSAGGEKEVKVFVFDAEKRKQEVSSLVEYVVGDWEVVRQAVGKGEDVLVMFATETYEDDPFKMVEAIYFYDRTTGETYFYEGGSYEPVTHGEGGPPCRLDQLDIKLA